MFLIPYMFVFIIFSCQEGVETSQRSSLEDLKSVQVRTEVGAKKVIIPNEESFIESDSSSVFMESETFTSEVVVEVNDQVDGEITIQSSEIVTGAPAVAKKPIEVCLASVPNKSNSV